jgi:hypothetical protein
MDNEHPISRTAKAPSSRDVGKGVDRWH